MNDCIGDEFRIIAKAKQALLDSTNIDTSLDEMACLDSFLFRCWQMGWLNKYDDSKDVVEVRHGRWEHDGSEWKYRFLCSECGYKLMDVPTNYCPNCGARMDGEEQEHE